MGLNLGPVIDQYSWILYRAFVLRQTQALSDTHGRQTHCHHRTSLQNCWYQRTNRESVSSTPPFHN